MKALLFINGTPPDHFPDLKHYHQIACSDGAFHYLLSRDFPLDRLTFVSGDFDGIEYSEIQHQIKANPSNLNFEIINTPDQDKTDFEKALEILLDKGCTEVDVYGGSGKEMDHFLGNLSSAFHFKDLMEIRFYDEFSTYFFIPKTFELENVKGKMISLYPFPEAKEVLTQGLNWELKSETLDLTSRIGTRNFAKEDVVSVRYSEGCLLFFVGGNYK